MEEGQPPVSGSDWGEMGLSVRLVCWWGLTPKPPARGREARAVPREPGSRGHRRYLVTGQAPLPCGPGRGHEHVQVGHGGQSWLYNGHQQLLGDTGLLWGHRGATLTRLPSLSPAALRGPQEYPLSPLGLSKSWPSVLRAIPDPCTHADGPSTPCHHVPPPAALLVPLPFTPDTGLPQARPAASSPFLTRWPGSQ